MHELPQFKLELVSFHMYIDLGSKLNLRILFLKKKFFFTVNSKREMYVYCSFC